MQVMISGTGFGATLGSVWLGSTYGTVNSWTDTQVLATLAYGATSGVAKLLQGGVWSNSIGFTVITPVVTSVIPGSAAPGIRAQSKSNSAQWSSEIAL